jgi:hypothetical protein
LFAATLLQALAMAIFATAHGVGALIAARVVQGISTGAAASAVGAGMLDIDRQKGTTANAVGPMLGTATGGIVSGLMVQYLPAPTQLVYLVLGTIFIAQAAGVAAMRETVVRRPGALSSLRPQFRLPAPVRAPMLLAAPALIAAWALVGFYGSLGPTLLRRLAHSTSLVLGGLALFVFAVSGAMTVLAIRTRQPRTIMTSGVTLLIAGVAITLFAVARGSLTIFFVGTSVAGAGFGAGFQGAIRTVLPLAAPGERAGVLSVLYVVAYLAMGLPAVLGGIRVVHGNGLLATAHEYGVAVMGLAALALFGAWLRSRNALVSEQPATILERSSQA